MNPEVESLMEIIEANQAILDRDKNRLREIQMACNHVWGEPEYDPTILKACHIPEFKKGSDYTPAMDIPERELKSWKRECQLCGKVQTTNKTKTVPGSKTPIFRGDKHHA